MTLKEQCDKLYMKLQGTRSIYWPCPIEDFAREIRNETLEEAAKVAEARAEEWNGKIDPGTCAVISGAEADSCAFWIRRLQSKRICAPGCTHDREIGCEKPW